MRQSTRSGISGYRIAVLVLGVNGVNLMLARQQEARAAKVDRLLARLFVIGTVVAYSALTIWGLRGAR